LQLERKLHTTIVATFDPIVNVQDRGGLPLPPEGDSLRPRN
jgi:hypothetical protein